MESAPSAQTPGDAQLLDLVWAGDSDAFGVLYARHVGAARRLAGLLTASSAEADYLVARTFAQVHEAALRNAGVGGAVRPYVLSVVAQLCGGKVSGSGSAGLEDTVIARAYSSLPDSAQAVLWHTEVEQAADADVAPFFGVPGGGVAPLRQDAVEGLREAYLGMRELGSAQPGCAVAFGQLGLFVRGELSEQQAAEVSGHLHGCPSCRGACEELADVGAALQRHRAAGAGPGRSSVFGSPRRPGRGRSAGGWCWRVAGGACGYGRQGRPRMEERSCSRRATAWR